MASLATSQTTFRCALPPSTLRRLTASRPIRPPARKQEQRRQWRALPVTEARRSNSGDRRQSPAVQVNPTKLLKEYGLPALGLLVAASVVAPLLGGLVFGAVALGVMASFSWIFVPVILALFGLPALMAAGVFATAITGALIVPSLISLALLGGGLWLGSRLAQRLFGGGSSDISPHGTIDVEARTVDDWKEEDTKEQRERDAELREFDELLRRREQFKQGYTRGTRGPPYP